MTARPGPAEISGGSYSIFFLSVFLKRFFNENLNFINNSFKIKYCSFKKRRILAKYSRNIGKKTARPAEILGLNGPARFAKPGFYNPGGGTLFCLPLFFRGTFLYNFGTLELSGNPFFKLKNLSLNKN